MITIQLPAPGGCAMPASCDWKILKSVTTSRRKHWKKSVYSFACLSARKQSLCMGWYQNVGPGTWKHQRRLLISTEPDFHIRSWLYFLIIHIIHYIYEDIEKTINHSGRRISTIFFSGCSDYLDVSDDLAAELSMEEVFNNTGYARRFHRYIYSGIPMYQTLL